MPRTMTLLRTVSAVAIALLAGCHAAPEDHPRPEPLGTLAPPAAPRTHSPPDSLIHQYAATNRFRYGLPAAFAFTPDGTALLYLRSAPREGGRHLYELNLLTGTERVVVTADRLLEGAEEELTPEERARRERARDAGRGLASFSLAPDARTLLLPLSGRIFLLDRLNADLRELHSDAGPAIDPRFSPDGARLAAARRGDLYVTDLTTGIERRLTLSEHPRVTNGEADFIAQEEMSRTEGYWWSPDSQHLAYQRTDTRMVETFRIADPADPGQSPREWAYPRAGRTNADVTLGIIPAAGGDTVWVEWDRTTYPYLATVKWPKNAPLTIVVQNRPQTESVIMTVDPDSGETTVLHTERDPAWVDLDQTVPRWLDDGSAFLWSTERAGAPQLELRRSDGSFLRTLTTPDDGYTALHGLDEAAGTIYFAARRRQIETHVARAPMDPALGRPSLLTEGAGLHTGHFANDASAWVLRGERLDGTRLCEVRRPNGDLVAAVPSAQEAPQTDIHAEFTTLTARRDFHVSIVRPSDFRADQQYPVIMRVYGGPTSVMVRPTRTELVVDQWLADHGFIVVRTDGRGTPGRGSAWLRSIKGDFISAPLDDLVTTVQRLGELYPEADTRRVGVFGWSWGGYFSAMAAARRADIFAAAVVGAPVTDWLDYDTHYTERYLGVPGEPGVNYLASSVLHHAAPPTAPMLLIHGTADDNVYFTHSMRLSDHLLRTGVVHEFLPLAGQTHSVTDPDIVVPMYERIAEFFVRTLSVER